MWTSDRTYYLTADQQTVVEAGDPRAAILLVAAGSAIPLALAARYGLGPEAKALSFPPANKRLAGPPHTKGRR